MKSNKLIGLTLFFLITNSIALETPKCPSVEQIRNIQFIKVDINKDSFGDWIVYSAPFNVDNVTWKLATHVSHYVSSQQVIFYTREKWKSIKISPPTEYPNGDAMHCYYEPEYGGSWIYDIYVDSVR